MTAKQKAKRIIEDMNNGPISQKLWESASDYAKSDLKRKCLIVVTEVLKNFKGLHKPEYCSFDAIGKRRFTYDSEYETHMTGYDMENYWKEVRNEIKTF